MDTMDDCKQGVDYRKLHQQLFDFVALWVTVADLLFFMILFATSHSPWISIALAALFPAMNVPSLKLSEKLGKPYISYTLAMTLLPMFLVCYFSGPDSPGWLMCLSGVTASHVMAHTPGVKRILTFGFIIMALLGSYAAGYEVADLLSVIGALCGFSLVLTRIFSFMSIQNDKLKTEVDQRCKAERELRETLALLTSSIRYASRIQRSILPDNGMLKRMLPKHFVLWKPRDVVGGDIYWSAEWGFGSIVVLGDCTGHGVPGAFMTLISTGAFERALMETDAGDVGTLIQRMHILIQTVLNQDSVYEEEGSDDGLELGACYIHPDKDKVTFAGAGFPLFYTKGDGIKQIKGDRKGIGYRHIPKDTCWANKVLDVEPGSCFYMSSDGIFDQIGGSKRRGFGKKRFMRFLEEIQTIPISEQGKEIYKHISEYQGKEKRRDDVSAIGFKI